MQLDLKINSSNFIVYNSELDAVLFSFPRTFTKTTQTRFCFYIQSWSY